MTDENTEHYANVHEDYKRIRDELLDMQADAKDALQTAKRILEDTEHPRAVETYSGLLKNVAVINGQLLDITKTYKDILSKEQRYNDKRDDLLSGPTTNNVFLGTTKDLQQHLKDAGILNPPVDVTPVESD